MHELWDFRPWPRVLLRYPLLILTALLLGALLAFAYSYAPLHRAKDWKIGYLEERLESRNDQVHELEEKLDEAHTSLDGTPSSDEVRALRTQLDEATKLAESREKEIGGLGRKLTSMTKSRDSWKTKHASALDELEVQSRPAPRTAAAPAPGRAAEVQQPESAPAAPAPAVANEADTEATEQE